MLGSFANQFNFSADNFGTNFGDSLGVTVNTGGAANTKGSNTNLLNGIAEDCYFLEVMFCQGTGTSGRMMADIKIDPAAGAGNAGSSWTTIIPDLAAQDPQFATQPGSWFGFPLYIPKGSAIGCALQWSGGSGTCKLAVRVFGKPSRPDLLKVGTKVQTLGANAASGVGTTFVPGTNAKGSYSATLGTLQLNTFAWQVSYLTTDTTQQGNGVLIDVAVNATNKVIVLHDNAYGSNASEQSTQMGGYMMGPPCCCDAPSGDDVYVRGASLIGAPDSSISAIVYAVQG